jgi:hypothetical protein
MAVTARVEVDGGTESGEVEDGVIGKRIPFAKARRALPRPPAYSSVRTSHSSGNSTTSIAFCR